MAYRLSSVCRKLGYITETTGSPWKVVSVLEAKLNPRKTNERRVNREKKKKKISGKIFEASKERSSNIRWWKVVSQASLKLLCKFEIWMKICDNRGKVNEYDRRLISQVSSLKSSACSGYWNSFVTVGNSLVEMNISRFIWDYNNDEIY